jgi:prolyl oligopeptidase
MFAATVVTVAGRKIGRGLGGRLMSTVALINTPSTNSLIRHWEIRDGEHAYMEDVLGDKALKWVSEVNDECVTALGDPKADPLYDDVLSILDSKDKIPYVRKIGQYYYNFWQDNSNPRGLYRRTSWASYSASGDKEIEWEVVIDVDALGKEEGESWVYNGCTMCSVDPDKDITRVLVKLSRGGADAVVVREFDLVTKRFVPESEDGFVLPESKSRVSWKTEDMLLIGTDFKDGESLTDSGYPRTVHEWKRGTPYLQAPMVYKGEATDVATTGYMSRHGKHAFEWRSRSLTFYTSSYCVRKDGQDEWHDLSATLPNDVDVSHFADQLLISLRTEWQGHKGGTLLAVDMEDLVTNLHKADFHVLFEPSERISLETYSALHTRLVLHTLENVKSRITFLTYNASTKTWETEGREPEAVCRGASLSAVDSDTSDEFWWTVNSFLTPSRLCRGNASEGIGSIAMASKSPVKSLKGLFNTTGLEETQGEAVSADGTVVPYFIIRKADAKSVERTTPQPTLMFGYGGFEISLTPSYSAVIGKTWLEAGGVFVYTNIRGGGEFGPSWHQAALKENRHKAYDDFIAIAEHLIATGVTTKEQLGIRGGSNGGLLMTNMMVRRPDLFGAISCAVPLIDMKRYSHLLAGASWMAEYGNPDTEDWSYLQKYSAYHNVALDAATNYPPLLMTTSTRDDRVHPYHARSFVKRLREVGVTNTLYYENIEGGHGGAADSKQQAFMTVLYINFLKAQLGIKK